MEAEMKNKAESMNLEAKVKELKAQLAKQDVENKDLSAKLDTFDSMKTIMPEVEKGTAICRHESDHPGLKFVEGGEYECLKTKDHNGVVAFNLVVKKNGVDFPYKYHTPTFYRFFNWKPAKGKEVSGEQFLKDMRARRGNK
jgi:hypothetical protein